MNYWRECIDCSFDEAGIEATEEQREAVARDAEGGHDNYGMAHGYDAIPSPVETRKDEDIASLEKQIAELEGDIDIYRQSVATRRGVEIGNVSIERRSHGKGDVIYNAGR